MRNLVPNFLVVMLFAILLPSTSEARDIHNGDSTLLAILNISTDTTRFQALATYQKKVENKRPRLSLEIANAMLDLSIKLKSNKYMVESYSVLGKSYIILNDYVPALKYYTLMLKKAEEVKDYKSQIDANINISNIYNTPEELSKSPNELSDALVYIQKALAIAREHQLADSEASILNELAVQYDIRKMHEKAIVTYKESIAAAQKAKDITQEMMGTINLGIALKNNKQLNESLMYYQKAGRIIDSMKYDVEKAYLSTNLATLYFEMGKDELSEKAALDAIDLAYELTIDPVRMDAYGTLQKLYERKKDYERAFLYGSKLAMLKDSIFNTEKSSQLKELQAKYETDIKDKTIESQTDQIAFNKKQSLFLWTGLGMLFCIAAVVFASQRRTSRLNRQITAQQQALLNQKKELETVNSIKDKLFSVISHDMRTPVNSLISFTQLLRTGNLSTEKLGLYSAQLNLTLNHTSTLMDNLLNWAASQMQGFHPVLERVDIGVVLMDVLEGLQAQASAKTILINNAISMGTMIRADSNMIALVIRNLLANAIKYTPNNGEIQLYANVSEKFLIITVADNGMGMDAEKMRLFNMATIQHIESTSGTDREKGTGLGLLLCKTFLKQMHGNITVQSNRGKGCRFDVAMPM